MKYRERAESKQTSRFSQQNSTTSGEGGQDRTSRSVVSPPRDQLEAERLLFHENAKSKVTGKMRAHFLAVTSRGAVEWVSSSQDGARGLVVTEGQSFSEQNDSSPPRPHGGLENGSWYAARQVGSLQPPRLPASLKYFSFNLDGWI